MPYPCSCRMSLMVTDFTSSALLQSEQMRPERVLSHFSCHRLNDLQFAIVPLNNSMKTVKRIVEIPMLD